MKFYVAGSWENKQGPGQLMDTLREMGHTITHDWTQYEMVYNDVHERSKKCAKADIKGVCDADIVVAIMTLDNYAYKGTRHGKLLNYYLLIYSHILCSNEFI